MILLPMRHAHASWLPYQEDGADGCRPNFTMASRECFVASACAGMLALSVGSPAAGDDAATARGTDAPLFVISKSENNNRVAYGVHLGADCEPVGPSPVFAFWQMRELGPGRREPLLSREVPYYGVRTQEPLGDGRVRIRLAAMPERPLVVEVRRDGARCTATASLPIAGAPADLSEVYADLAWPFGVRALVLTGTRAGGARVREVLRR